MITGVHVFNVLVLKDAIQAIDKIEGDQMVVHDLPSFMRIMGVRLTDYEFEQALKQVPVDGEYIMFSHPYHWTYLPPNK